MTIPIDAENEFDKIQHTFMIRTFSNKELKAIFST